MQHSSIAIRLLSFGVFVLPTQAQAGPRPVQITSVFRHGSNPPAMVFDSARNRIVVMTEFDGGTLWEWDGSAWARIAATLPLHPFLMTYDPQRQRVLLIQAPHVQARNLYEYDGHAIRSLGPAPALNGIAMDHVRNRLVGIGGGRTWEWDGATWQEVAIGTSPPLSLPYYGILAFDAARARCVTYVYAVFPPSTWEWDGTAWTTTPGVPISQGQLVYDSTRSVVMSVSPIYGVDVWNGAFWMPSPQLPLGFQAVVLLADAPTRGVVYALSLDSKNNSRIYGWDGFSWNIACLAPQPERSFVEPTYDLQRRRVVLFGGRNPWSQSTDTLFEFDGTAWHDLSAMAGPGPSARADHAQVYDPRSAETLVLGGSTVNGPSSECWAWNGTTWRPFAVPLPSPRASVAAVVDLARNRLVVLGGRDAAGPLADHIEWDGAAWRHLPNPPFAAHDRGAIGYDPVRAMLVFQPIATGPTPVPTWLWNGSTWIAGPSDGPHAQSRSLAWNARRGRLEMLALSQGALGEIRRFDFDGSTWATQAVTEASGAIVGHPMYDADHRRLLLYRGRSMVAYPEAAASTAAYGVGCGGSGPVTTLTSFGPPRLGTATHSLDARATASSSPAFLALAAAQGNFAIGSCTLLLGSVLTTTTAFTDANGFARFALPVPNTQALARLALFAQVGVLDPAAPSRFTLSQGLALTLGN